MGHFSFFTGETEVGLNVWIVALGYIIYAIWNSVNDPLIGYFTDKPNKLWKKYGKRFPFIIIGGIPSIFMLALIFTPPYLDPVAAAWIYFGWILFSSCMFELFYTMFQLSNAALYPDKFRLDKDRRKAGFFRMGLGLVGTAVGLIIPPLFISYGDRQSYTIMAWIFVIINLVFFLTLIPGHRESAQMRERYGLEQSVEKKLPFLETLKIAILSGNKFDSIILAIEPENFESVNASLTSKVEGKIDEVINMLKQELDQYGISLIKKAINQKSH